MNKAFAIFFFFFFAPFLIGAESAPYAVEAKVRAELEEGLSRLIPSDQFLVQVTATIGTRTEHKLVEGETILAPAPAMQKPVVPMPGFKPDMEETIPSRPTQTRQVYREVETPFLESLTINATFDDTVVQDTAGRARQMLQNYVSENYPRVTRLHISTIPMLKKKKETPVPAPTQKAEKPENQIDKNPANFWWRYGPLIACAAFILFVLFILGFLRLFSQSSGKNASSDPRFSPFALPPLPASLASYLGTDNRGAQRLAKSAADSLESHQNVSEIRRRVLQKFISHSESFRLFYPRLPKESQDEIQALFEGPAFDSLIEGIGIAVQRSGIREVPDAEMRLTYYEKTFDEFVLAKDWKDKQFFGFLQHLSNEQLISLIYSETPERICLMLRFLRPAQSAFVLDNMTAQQRREVIAHVFQISQIPLSEILNIENQVRASVRRLPNHFLNSAPEEFKFWGTVFSEAQQQDSIFEELEQTNPEIYANVKKYRFSLEELAAVPDSLVSRVIAEVENDELCLALSTCPPHIVESILDSLSQLRRQVIEQQLPNYRRAPKADAQKARANLSRRFRDTMEAAS